MLVVGGTYREVCEEANWDQLYGSGLRAAAALSELIPSIRFATCIGGSERNLLDCNAATFGIDVSAVPIAQTLEFHYAHGLAEPRIYPKRHTITERPSLDVKDDSLLCFGMLDASPVVHGEQVVYDPQSAYSPESFRSSGSTAKRLAVVCNRHEAWLLTGESDLQRAAASLLATEHAECVVVKCGSDGAVVATKSGIVAIPAFRTGSVWPIGSGDVFAAMFSYYWGHESQCPHDAAYRASVSTAYYCETRSLPIPTFDELDRFDFAPIGEKTIIDRKPRAYLAGPFFNMMERWMVGQAREALANFGFDVFSPFHDVGIGDSSDVVPKDIEAINKSDVMFAIIDNIDPGTIFEIGYARSSGKPVVVLAENIPSEPLKMLEGTGCKICVDFVTAIYHTVWALRV